MKGYNKNLLAVILALLVILFVLAFDRYQALATNRVGNYCSPDHPELCAR